MAVEVEADEDLVTATNLDAQLFNSVVEPLNYQFGFDHVDPAGAYSRSHPQIGEGIPTRSHPGSLQRQPTHTSCPLAEERQAGDLTALTVEAERVNGAAADKTLGDQKVAIGIRDRLGGGSGGSDHADSGWITAGNREEIEELSLLPEGARLPGGHNGVLNSVTRDGPVEAQIHIKHEITGNVLGSCPVFDYLEPADLLQSHYPALSAAVGVHIGAGRVLSYQLGPAE